MRPFIIHLLPFIDSSIGPSKQHERETPSSHSRITRGSEANRSSIRPPPTNHLPSFHRPSTHHSTHPPINPSFHRAAAATRQPTLPSTHPSTHPSLHPPTHRVTHSPIHPFIHRSLHPFIPRPLVHSSAHPHRRLKSDKEIEIYVEDPSQKEKIFGLCR